MQIRVICLALPLACVSACGADETAVSPWRVYVTNELDGTLTVFEGPTNHIVATKKLGKRPRGSFLSADGATLYIALSGSPAAPPGTDESTLPPPDRGADGIGVFNTQTLKLQRILRGVSDPEQVVASADGRRLYVASEDAGVLVVFDNGQVKARLDVGGEPEGVAIAPDDRTVYVASEETGVVSVIDTQTNKIRATFAGGQRPRTIAIAPDGKRGYVADETGGVVTMFDTSTARPIARMRIPGEAMRPMGVSISNDSSKVFITTGRGGTLLRLDGATLKIEKRVTVGPRPWGIRLSPDGRFAYTANGSSNDVTVVDTRMMTVVSRVATGATPWGIAVSGR